MELSGRNNFWIELFQLMRFIYKLYVTLREINFLFSPILYNLVSTKTKLLKSVCYNARVVHSIFASRVFKNAFVWNMKHSVVEVTHNEQHWTLNKHETVHHTHNWHEMWPSVAPLRRGFTPRQCYPTQRSQRNRDVPSVARQICVLSAVAALADG